MLVVVAAVVKLAVPPTGGGEAAEFAWTEFPSSACDATASNSLATACSCAVDVDGADDDAAWAISP